MCCGIFSCSHKLNVARCETFCCWKGVLIITCFVLIPFPHAVSFYFLRIAILSLGKGWMVDKILRPKKYFLMSDMVWICPQRNVYHCTRKKLLGGTMSCKSHLPSFCHLLQQSFYSIRVKIKFLVKEKEPTAIHACKNWWYSRLEMFSIAFDIAVVACCALLA